MLYDRKIKYLDYIVGGERLQSAGFVKAEVRDEVCRMRIHINGLHLTDSFERKVILRGSDRDSYLTTVRIEGGRGDTGEIVANTSRIGSGNIPYSGLEEIIIPIDREREIRCVWSLNSDKKGAASLKEHEQGINEHNDVQQLGGNDKYVDMQAAQMVQEQPPQEQPPQEQPLQEQSPQEEPLQQYASLPPLRYPLEDKWRQLSALYEHGNMFGEMSDSLLIRPGDFVILPDKYYKLVSNSFLLHGYHNYGYMLLARTEKRGEVKYYICVPGCFYEKEKQAAIMFGFESFECGKDYIQPGDFGYYMIKVEL